MLCFLFTIDVVCCYALFVTDFVWCHVSWSLFKCGFCCSFQLSWLIQRKNPFESLPCDLLNLSDSLLFRTASSSYFWILASLQIAMNVFTSSFVQTLPFPVLAILNALVVVLAGNGQGIKTRKGGGRGEILPNNFKTLLRPFAFTQEANWLHNCFNRLKK